MLTIIEVEAIIERQAENLAVENPKVIKALYQVTDRR
jgi:hypothetical protein